MPFLEIKNMDVKADGKNILENINLKLEKGKIYVIMGPNGSGKSTLANVLMGNPKYKVTRGKILFNGNDITNISADERAKKGIFLSMQNPIEVPGVIASTFLRTASNREKISLLDFKKILEKKSDELNINKEFLSRYINENLSGGERKKMEILQMLILNPKLAILDEIDSGLDMDSLKLVANMVKKFMDKNKTLILITHYMRILDYLNLDKIFIMQKGKIILEGKKEIIENIEKEGYSGIK